MSKPSAKNWFSYGRGEDFMLHTTEAQARRECLRELKCLHREVKEGAWGGLVPAIFYGPVTHRAVGGELKKIAQSAAPKKTSAKKFPRQKLTMGLLKVWSGRRSHRDYRGRSRVWWATLKREAVNAIKAKTEADAEQVLLDAGWLKPGDRAADLRRKFKP